MKTKFIYCSMVILLQASFLKAQKMKETQHTSEDFDYIGALKDTLESLSERTEHEIFQLHFESIIQVIEAKNNNTSTDSTFLENMYVAFNDTTDTSSAKKLESYLKRERSFILAWESPTDSSVSFSWLRTPVDWEPEQEYPLYIQLHGNWDVAGNPIDYLTFPFLSDPATSFAFEDGYLLSPWGRGNRWYQDIAETDILECMYTLEEFVQIDTNRKYICGHSMGGYGAWHIAHRSADIWAALGVHAGALVLWPDELTADVAEKLKDIPTYFVCGTNDSFLSSNETAFQLLTDAGNANLSFVTFEGGHEYREVDVEGMYEWLREYEKGDDDKEITDAQTPVASLVHDLAVYSSLNSAVVTISYYLSAREEIKLQIINSQGMIVAERMNHANHTGKHEISWNTDRLPAGMYICRYKAGNSQGYKKFIVF